MICLHPCIITIMYTVSQKKGFWDLIMHIKIYALVHLLFKSGSRVSSCQFLHSQDFIYEVLQPAQRMRFQERLYGIYTVCFQIFMNPCNCKLAPIFGAKKTLFNLGVVRFKEFQVVFTVLFFVGNPVVKIQYKTISIYKNIYIII